MFWKKKKRLMHLQLKARSQANRPKLDAIYIGARRVNNKDNRSESEENAFNLEGPRAASWADALKAKQPGLPRNTFKSKSMMWTMAPN
jgi:hypothetical protein